MTETSVCVLGVLFYDSCDIFHSNPLSSLNYKASGRVVMYNNLITFTSLDCMLLWSCRLEANCITAACRLNLKLSSLGRIKDKLKRKNQSNNTFAICHNRLLKTQQCSICKPWNIYCTKLWEAKRLQTKPMHVISEHLFRLDLARKQNALRCKIPSGYSFFLIRTIFQGQDGQWCFITLCFPTSRCV